MGCTVVNKLECLVKHFVNLSNFTLECTYEPLRLLFTSTSLAMDKSADLKDLDLTCAGRGVWLVKVSRTFIHYCYRAQWSF